MQKFNWQLVRSTLFSYVAIFAGCSITENLAQLPPLVGAERQLASVEKITSDPPEKTAEILSVVRTVVSEIPKNSGEVDLESAVRIYNRAAVDLASELPKLTQYRGSPESFTIQDRHTGETYRLQLGPTERTDYPSTFSQELLDARKLRVRRGEEAVVTPGLGGTLVGVHRSVPPGSQPPRFEPTSGYPETNAFLAVLF